MLRGLTCQGLPRLPKRKRTVAPMSLCILPVGEPALPSPDLAPVAGNLMAALLKRIKQRDASALEALYAAYAPRVRAYALQLLRDSHAAQDVTHEVFMRVWRYAAAYDEARSPRPEAWLFQIARNQAINEMAVRSRTLSTDAMAESSTEEEVLADESTHQADPIIDWVSSRSAAFQKSVQALPSNYRQVVFMRFHNDMSNPEIAEHLGVPLGTVKTWLRRSLIQLRAELRVPAVADAG